MNADIEHLVKQYEICKKFVTSNCKKPMVPHDIPTRPWKKIGIDYFTFLNQDYLLMVDYFSKYPEVIPVSSKTADATIKVMQSVFSRLGIPDTIVADNMPFIVQNSETFLKLGIYYQHIKSKLSPI